MDFQAMINSPGLWIASSVMVIATMVQALVFFRTSLKEAHEIGIERQRYRAGIRSAIITSIGPSFLSCDCAFEHGGGDRRTDHLDAALRCGRGQNGAGCHLSGRRHGGRGGWYRVFRHHCFFVLSVGHGAEQPGLAGNCSSF